MKRTIIGALALAGTLLSTSAHAWWENDWQFRKAIAVDTTAKGAAISEAPGRTAVLVRLHTGNFSFDGMADNGSDIRFVAADDKTPLHSQVDSFDAKLGVAQIWVDVPAVQGGQRQDLWMYYGNKKATAAADGRQVFDADYVSVLHFDGGQGAQRDSTAYANNARSAVGAATDGVVGKALVLDGQPLTLAPTPSLASTAGGAFTFSAWVRPSRIDGTQLLYARRGGAASLRIGLEQGVPFVAINGQQARAAAALVAEQWQQISVTVSGKQTVLYVNGQRAANAEAALPALDGVTAIGGDVAAEGGAGAGFSGAIDEVRLSRVARNPAMLLADATMQGAESKMLSYGADEKASGVGFGAFGFIFGSVPLDAWIVMGILAVMLVHSWWIMISKNRYVSRTAQGNREFREFFSQVGNRVDALADRPELVGALQNSSLSRIYATAIRELSARKLIGPSAAPASAAALESIRVSMDAARLRENDVLAARLGGLSNAIAGGPYVGLFGTVVGIMLVFANAAMAGDVNINAVAPGMAAALMATAGGLLVAIPALFGYNQLLGRNKTVISDMRMFVDEFMARLAEQQSSAPAHRETTLSAVPKHIL